MTTWDSMRKTHIPSYHLDTKPKGMENYSFFLSPEERASLRQREAGAKGVGGDLGRR
jgi:hypothetical protein